MNRRLLAALRQVAHLLGYDGEASPLLSGARGFDSGIECEQVRLIGKFGNRAGNCVDRLSLPGKRQDGLGDSLDTLADVGHTLHRLFHNGNPLLGDG